GLHTIKRRCAAAAINCNSAHSPRFFTVANFSHSSKRLVLNVFTHSETNSWQFLSFRPEPERTRRRSGGIPTLDSAARPRPKAKGATHRPRLPFPKVLLYTPIISYCRGQMGHTFELYFPFPSLPLTPFM